MTSNTSLTGTASISAMELRKNPGFILDRVDLRQESLIVRRAGKAKAVLIPVSQFENIERMKEESKKRLFATINRMQKNASKYDPEEVQAAIDEATNQK